MNARSQTSLHQSVRSVLEPLEQRLCLAVSYALGDFDFNGSTDVRIEAGGGNHFVRILDDGTSARLFTDNNGNQNFIDPGEYNGVDLGEIETFDIRLRGGDDTLEFIVDGDWTGVNKSILANLTYELGVAGINDEDQFRFNSEGFAIEEGSNLTIELQTGAASDVAELDFDWIDSSLVHVTADMGNDFLIATAAPGTEYGMVSELGDLFLATFHENIKNESSVGVDVQFGASFVFDANGESTLAVEEQYVGIALNLAVIRVLDPVENWSTLDIDVHGGEVPSFIQYEEGEEPGPTDIVLAQFGSDIKTNVVVAAAAIHTQANLAAGIDLEVAVIGDLTDDFFDIA